MTAQTFPAQLSRAIEDGKEDVPQIHVCYVLGSLKAAGTERQALALMRGLDKRRFRVSLVLFEPDGMENIPDNVDSLLVLHAPQESSRWIKGLAGWIAGFFKMYSCFAAWKPDIVHAYLAGPSIMGVVPARLAKFPVFIGSRRSQVAAYRRERWIASVADNMSFKLAHFNLANCAAVEREMVAMSGCPSRKCLTVYNGVDTIRFHPGGAAAWRRSLGWDASHIVFGLVANFYAYKRHTDFLAAAALILQDHPQARFVMAGADYGTQHTIVEKIKARGLNLQVKVLEGAEKPEEIFAGLDVLVCPSDTEGCSNVLLEAMASAKPVIATAVGGNPEIVADGETGFLVPARSPRAIAGAADCLIRDANLRFAMGTRSRQRVVEHFSLNAMVRAHERLYTRLISNLRHNSK